MVIKYWLKFQIGQKIQRTLLVRSSKCWESQENTIPRSHSILLEYDLPYEFPEEVENEAKNLSNEITEKEIARRRDMRGDLTFTIDPKDAKDFDDALSFKVLKNGNYEVGIHIADVSHYVQPGTIFR